MAVMIEGNECVRVAPDRNLIRNSTTRRYPTALEEMRGGQVVILPPVDARMKRRIPAAERSCADRIFSKKGSLGAGMLRPSKWELARAAGAWREDGISRRFQFTLRSGDRGRAFRMRETDMQPSRSSPHGPEPGRRADLRAGMVSRRKRSRRQEPEVDHRRKIARASCTQGAGRKVARAKMEEIAPEDVVGATIPREWSPRKRQQRSSNAGGFTRNWKGLRANLRRAR